ncbi:phage holin family protein [Leminorella grimontii]|uniref:phage holin family protein n=1 Tax=Leminorella grimontii TaxID=82981 RepID=UPI00208D5E92|nr:phage holin family protein [Leminorella grimontii]GKX58360.1 holin [Leminorella grimontii]
MRMKQEPTSFEIYQWLILLLLSAWGGIVRYLIDIKTNNAHWSWFGAVAQVAVSGFTGLIGGFISLEAGLSLYMTFASAGMAGAMGSIALTYFWNRLTGTSS